MYIYVITNSVTGKIYIGQHKGNNLKKYLQTKLSQAVYELKRKGKGGGSRLFNSMRKHPKEVWSIEPLMSDVQTREELDRLERLLIALYDTRNPDVGYNICRGGEGRTAPLSPEERVKLRDNNKAYWNKLGEDHTLGKTFGRLTVLSEEVKRSAKGRKLWNCQCSCGGHSRVSSNALKSGNIRSCGCLISEAATKRVGGTDLLGQTFDHLTVEAEAGRCPWNQKLWKCRCTCGNYVTTRTAALKSHRAKDCGCIAKSKNVDIKREVVRLRVEKNMRLTEIATQLNLPVPTCHGWLKGYPRTIHTS